MSAWKQVNSYFMYCKHAYFENKAIFKEMAVKNLFCKLKELWVTEQV